MKKIQQNFRLCEEISALLELAAEKSGIPKTLIVEDALSIHLGKNVDEAGERQGFILRTLGKVAAPQPPVKQARGSS